MKKNDIPSYTPNPIDTSDVVFSPEINELIETAGEKQSRCLGERAHCRGLDLRRKTQ